ncbi:hypothetical protein ILYODFUR_034685 [Ilyodon furcidens]|uniref:Uncharacterized protein n=1 Tax=Ilyodon furcidens TaxID=33524 RepID=A0ABV0TTH2_9TELE
MIILMSCHSLSAAKESIRMFYMSSGESFRLQDCVPSEEFSFLLSYHLQSKLCIFSISLSLFSSNVIAIASDILRSSSSAASPKLSSSSSPWVEDNYKLGMFFAGHWSTSRTKASAEPNKSATEMS